MHIETWAQLIKFLQSLLPILAARHKSNAMFTIAWAKTKYGQTTGIDLDEKSSVLKVLRDIKPTIPDSWSDEISEASMFLARLNTSPDADKWHTRQGCSLWKGYWYVNACHDEPEPTVITCASIRTQTGCVNNGCYWYNGLCHSEPEPPPPPPPPVKYCHQHTTQQNCLSNGCYWYDGACHASPKPPPPPPPPPLLVCSDYKTQVKCLSEGCYWWAGSCHDTPEIIPPGDSNPVREFAKQVNLYCATIPLTRPLELINCGILTAILNITADVFDFLGVKK